MPLWPTQTHSAKRTNTITTRLRLESTDRTRIEDGTILETLSDLLRPSKESLASQRLSMTLSTLSQLSRLIDVDVFITFVRNLSSCRHSRSLDHLDEAESEIPALLAHSFQ